MPKTLTPKLIYEEMSKTYLGNEEVKRSLSVLGYMHACNILHDKQQQPMWSPELKSLKPKDFNNNALIIGKSGSGKTFGAQVLSEAIETLVEEPIPVHVIDCTALAPTGYKGGDLMDHIQGSFTNMKKAQNSAYSIVVFDEFDKLCQEASVDGEFYRRIQYQILRMVEGHDIQTEKLNIPTHNFLFLFCGNFPSIRKLREDKAKDAPNFGFGTTSEEKKEDTDTDLTKKAKELEEVGVASQLLGRLSAVVETTPLPREALKEIIMRKASVYELFSTKDTNICTLTEEEIESILDDVENRDTGIRAIDARLYDLIHNRMFEHEDAVFEVKTEEERLAEEIPKRIKAAMESVSEDAHNEIPLLEMKQLIYHTLSLAELYNRDTYEFFVRKAEFAIGREEQEEVLLELLEWSEIQRSKTGDD